jgi:hypothetical protein
MRTQNVARYAVNDMSIDELHFKIENLFGMWFHPLFRE